MNGDNVVCELCPGVWLDGVVQGTPRRPRGRRYRA